MSTELKQSLGGECGLPIVLMITMALLVARSGAQAHAHFQFRIPIWCATLTALRHPSFPGRPNADLACLRRHEEMN